MLTSELLKFEIKRNGMCEMELTPREARMVVIMRQKMYGTFNVNKVKGEIIRIVASESITIDSTGGFKLDI